MGNNLLNNINGEYVKFYYTTNKVLPDLLKNTGALVVYNNIEDKTTYTQNHIYLGGDLISTGIGFHDEAIKNNLIHINEIWDSETSYFHNQIDKLYSYYSYFSSTALYEEGNINKCEITSNLVQDEEYSDSIKLTSLFNIVEEDYKPAYISRDVTTITYTLINYENITYNVNFFDTSYAIIDSIEHDHCIDLPVGTLITNIKKDITVELCDESEISYHCIRYSYQYAGDIYSNTSYLDNKIFNKVINRPNNIENSSNYAKIKYEINFLKDRANIHNSVETYMVHPDENILLDQIYLRTSGTLYTDKLKNISLASKNNNRITKSDLNIYSVKNLIPENTLIGKPVKINGKLPLVYCPCYNSGIHQYDGITNAGLKTVRDFTRINIHNENKITIPRNTVRLYIGVPRTTIINNIYLIDKFNNNTKINITGLFIDFTNQTKNISNKGVTPKYLDAYPLLYRVTQSPNNGISDKNRINLYFDYKYLFIDLFDYVDNNINSEEIDILIDCENFDNKSNFINDLDQSNIHDYFNFRPNDNGNWLCNQNENYWSHNWISIKSSNKLNNYIDISSKMYSGDNVEIYNNPSKYWNTDISQTPDKITFEKKYNIIGEYYKNNNYVIVTNGSNKVIHEDYNNYSVFNVNSERYLKFIYSDLIKSASKNIDNANCILFSKLSPFVSQFIIRDKETNTNNIVTKVTNYFNSFVYSELTLDDNNKFNINDELDIKFIPESSTKNNIYNLVFNFEDENSGIIWPYIILPNKINISNIEYNFISNTGIKKSLNNYRVVNTFKYKSVSYNIIILRDDNYKGGLNIDYKATGETYKLDNILVSFNMI